MLVSSRLENDNLLMLRTYFSPNVFSRPYDYLTPDEVHQLDLYISSFIAYKKMENPSG